MSLTKMEKVSAVQQVQRQESGAEFVSIEFDSFIRCPSGDVKKAMEWISL